MIIADTGPLVALFNPRDSYHEWSLEILSTLSPPLWTCEAVLTEAAYLTGQPAKLIKKVAAGILRLGIDIEAQSDAIGRLIRQYGPRMELTDACVVRMSELFRESKVLTLDRRDFSIYRRNQRQVIPLIAPPEYRSEKRG